MAVRGGRKILTGLRGLGGRIPTKSTRGARRVCFAARKPRDRFRMNDGSATRKHAVSESGYMARSGENTGVSTHSTETTSVFIVNLALNHAVTERFVIGGGRYICSDRDRRVKGGTHHPEWSKDLMLAKMIESFSGQTR